MTFPVGLTFAIGLTASISTILVVWFCAVTATKILEAHKVFLGLLLIGGMVLIWLAAVVQLFRWFA